eukprot:1159502-Pelagomonas_calceolata.AAC.20
MHACCVLKVARELHFIPMITVTHASQYALTNTLAMCPEVITTARAGVFANDCYPLQHRLSRQCWCRFLAYYGTATLFIPCSSSQCLISHLHFVCSPHTKKQCVARACWKVFQPFFVKGTNQASLLGVLTCCAASAKEEAVATAESGGDPLVITQTQTGLGEIQPPVAEEEEEDGAQEGEAGVEEEQQPQQQEEGNGEGGEQQQQGEEGNEEEQQLEGGEYEQVGMGDDGDGDGVVQAAEQEGDQGLGDGEGETTEEGGITGLEKVKANRRRQELLKEPGLREGPSGEAEEVHTGGAEAGGEAQGGATEAAGDARSDREQEYGEAEGGAVDNIQTGDEEAGAEGGGGDEEVEGEVQAGGEGAVDEAEGEAARGDGEAGDVLGADATAAAAAAAAGALVFLHPASKHGGWPCAQDLELRKPTPPQNVQGYKHLAMTSLCCHKLPPVMLQLQKENLFLGDNTLRAPVALIGKRMAQHPLMPAKKGSHYAMPVTMLCLQKREVTMLCL